MTLREEASFIIPGVEVRGVGEDQEDDLVLSTAISGGADYLVTGDKHLQGIGDYRGVIILSPRAFLDVLEVELHRAQ